LTSKYKGGQVNTYKILKGIKVLKFGRNPKVSSVTNHTAEIKPLSFFIAVRGSSFDPHPIIRKVALKGVSGVLIQDKKAFDSLKDLDITVALSNNTRRDQALIASRFYGDPSSKLKVVGVTGTNGKTSTSLILKQFLEILEKPTGIIGTLGYFFRGEKFGEDRTTPDAIKWFKLLRTFLELGAEYVVAEVSSHALEQYRVYGTRFEGGIFTNLTQDHLDFHKTIENYFNAKRKLPELILERNPEGIFAVNIDDDFGRLLYDEFKEKLNMITYGKSRDADLRIEDFRLALEGQHFILTYKGKHFNVFTKLLGEFNIYNITGAMAYLLKKGYNLECLTSIAPKIKPIPGRFEAVASDFLVVNDYAHTPDALEKVLKSLRLLKPKKLITVFGAGGDRDKEKRPLMGKVVEEYSDIVIITSDNPRSEDPLQIIEDIKSGMELKKETYMIVDREKAIEKAICLAEKNDIVLIAGKGHEKYQIIGDKKIPFDDIKVAKKYMRIKKLGWKKIHG
jgi:UDP-N-acetylmuramoyl-L-alanyl-D-glutamate--2,6-diaminopimelate ligase